MTKQRPILFSTPMVQALLNGSKTQTRRTVKNQPKDEPVYAGNLAGVVPIYRHHDKHDGVPIMHMAQYCPYGQVGDILWVRETLYFDDHSGDDWCYQAGNSPIECEHKGIAILENVNKKAIPSIHMPKVACRLFLQIKSIQIERLQDITEADAIAEGIEKLTPWPEVPDKDRYRIYSHRKDETLAPNLSTFDPKFSYLSLWEFINGESSVKENPWVWVVEFEVIPKPAENGN